MRSGIETHLDAIVQMLTPASNDARETSAAKREELQSRRASNGTVIVIVIAVTLPDPPHVRCCSLTVLQSGALDALVESLAQAYMEVRSLLGRDTWPRFRSSRYFPLYQATLNTLLEQEARLTAAFSTIDGASPSLKISVRRTSERSEEHTSELQSLMRISYAVFCLTKKIHTQLTHTNNT